MTGQLTFVDTHAHLNDEQFARDAGDVITRSSQVGVTRIVNVAFAQRRWHDAIELTATHSGVVYSLGVHPNNADEWSDAARAALLELVSQQNPVAIGETGLDYFWERVPRETQIQAFADQLDIATEYDLPVVIHMRGDVEADIRETLESRTGVSCVFHSFDGSPELCEWIVNRGWMIGVGGLMSRRSAKTLRRCLATVPMNQLLLETDSPYLSPTGWPEKRNTPESIPITAEHLARLLSVPLDEVADRTTANAHRVFRLAFTCAGEEQATSSKRTGER